MVEDRYTHLKKQADDLPVGSLVRLAILEEMVREADRNGDDGRSFWSRIMLARTCRAAGHPERSLLAFTECLALADSSGPAFAHVDALLKNHVRNCRSVVEFPSVTREQIEVLLDDLTRRVHEHGRFVRRVLALRWMISLTMGDRERAIEQEREWSRTPLETDDCAVCEVANRVWLYTWLEDDEAAIRHAEPLVSGEMTCDHNPEGVHNVLMIPLVRLGRVREAKNSQKRGFSVVSEQGRLQVVPQHIAVLVGLQEIESALRLFDRHSRVLEGTGSPFLEFLFKLASWMLFEALQELPKHEQHVYSASLGSPIAELRVEYERRTRELARAFDERNGNDQFTRTIDYQRDLCRLD